MQRVQFIFALSIRSKSYFLFNNKNTSWFFLICTCCHFRCLHINIPNCYYALLYLQHLRTIKIFNFSNISKVDRFFLSLFIKIKIRIIIFQKNSLLKSNIQYLKSNMTKRELLSQYDIYFDINGLNFFFELKVLRGVLQILFLINISLTSFY